MDVDLWEDEDEDFSPSPAMEVFSLETSTPTSSNVAPSFGQAVLLSVADSEVRIFSKLNLNANDRISAELSGLYGFQEEPVDTGYFYKCSFSSINAYILRHILAHVKSLSIDPASAELLARYANRVTPPKAHLAENRKYIEVVGPKINSYYQILKKVQAYPTANGYRVPLARALDFEKLNADSNSLLPKIQVDSAVLELNRLPLSGFDGTLDSLRTISLSDLNVISINNQSWKALKKSGKSIEEKFHDFGVDNLYDLFFTFPRRFIDKSNPQEIERLEEGESITTVGVVRDVENLPNNMGIKFIIANSRGRELQCAFWRQQWLKTKFKPGDEVLLTGKASWFRNKIQLNGSSIEHADEAAVLPIVPVYKQSETRGITTALIMASMRELISRMGEVTLPAYLEKEGEFSYTQALRELHFPTSIENFKAACDVLAYYELVYTQLIMLENKENAAAKKGIAQPKSARNLQNKAVALLPFKLTNSQIKAVRRMNELMADEVPSQVLLNADVGAGKTLVAQLACLQAVGAGRQAVLLAPTEILAQQLFSTFEKLLAPLKEKGEEVRIAYLHAGIKAREKKPILAAITSGEVDIVVGTSSVMGESVKYKDLSLICIDEQQKFGAAQRSKLLQHRSDGLIPDLLMQTATPIPRSAAQVFYGDVEMLELNEKPPGRLPILTEWVQEDPKNFLEQVANPIWTDVQAEAAAGNQIFIITPMVFESEKVDAASVEKTFKTVKSTVLANLRVGFVHGQMKKEEQQEEMRKFRNKEYDAIVGSTVVEVGVDIPDATRVVILSADRLGASSLHQIRGRVGRNDRQAKCYLVSEGKTENAQVRLQSLVDNEDGYAIALTDLSIRGEGKIFGAEQSGSSEMIFASLAKHSTWIPRARDAAKAILGSPARSAALADAYARFVAPERLF